MLWPYKYKTEEMAYKNHLTNHYLACTQARCTLYSYENRSSNLTGHLCACTALSLAARGQRGQGELDNPSTTRSMIR